MYGRVDSFLALEEGMDIVVTASEEHQRNVEMGAYRGSCSF
jgi:hypothetical protein